MGASPVPKTGTNVPKTGSLDAKFSAWAELHGRRSGPPCGFARLPADMQEFVHRCVESGKQYSVIAGFLKSEGHQIKAPTLSRHMRGSCSCGRQE